LLGNIATVYLYRFSFLEVNYILPIKKYDMHTNNYDTKTH